MISKPWPLPVATPTDLARRSRISWAARCIPIRPPTSPQVVPLTIRPDGAVALQFFIAAVAPLSAQCHVFLLVITGQLLRLHPCSGFFFRMNRFTGLPEGSPGPEGGREVCAGGERDLTAQSPDSWLL